MLVLSRKQDESIVIGDGIVVKILAIKGSVVKVGVEAPKDTKITRAELDRFEEERE